MEGELTQFFFFYNFNTVLLKYIFIIIITCCCSSEATMWKWGREKQLRRWWGPKPPSRAESLPEEQASVFYINFKPALCYSLDDWWRSVWREKRVFLQSGTRIWKEELHSLQKPWSGLQRTWMMYVPPERRLKMLNIFCWPARCICGRWTASSLTVLSQLQVKL